MKKQRLSQVIQSIPPSGIRRFFDLAANMDDVISLGVGEPDFVTPWRTREAGISSLERGFTTYTSNSGLEELRQAIADYLQHRFELTYDKKQQLLITVGASEGIDLAIRSVIDPGEEVLVVEPCYVSYDPVVRLAGGVPVTIQTTKETSFKITAEQLREHISPRTKAIIFCYPNNPTGSVMTAADWAEAAEVIREHDLLVISDEIYAELSYDRPFDSIATLPGLQDRTILISGFSKAFAMTGWRVGYAAGPSDIIQAMTKMHQYTMLCAPILAQRAALEAVKYGMEDMGTMVDSYRRRRNYFVEALKEIGMDCHKPEGAFYAFPSIQRTGLSSMTFAEELLKEEKVAVVPGNVFGESGEGHVRCSYATSLEELKEAVTRMGRFVEKRAQLV